MKHTGGIEVSKTAALLARIDKSIAELETSGQENLKAFIAAADPVDVSLEAMHADIDSTLSDMRAVQGDEEPEKTAE